MLSRRRLAIALRCGLRVGIVAALRGIGRVRSTGASAGRTTQSAEEISSLMAGHAGGCPVRHRDVPTGGPARARVSRGMSSLALTAILQGRSVGTPAARVTVACQARGPHRRPKARLHWRQGDKQPPRLLHRPAPIRQCLIHSSAVHHDRHRLHHLTLPRSLHRPGRPLRGNLRERRSHQKM